MVLAGKKKWGEVCKMDPLDELFFGDDDDDFEEVL